MALQILREGPARQTDRRPWPTAGAWMARLIAPMATVVRTLGAVLTTDEAGRTAWTEREKFRSWLDFSER